MCEQPVFDNRIAASGMGGEGLIFKMMGWNTNSSTLSWDLLGNISLTFKTQYPLLSYLWSQKHVMWHPKLMHPKSDR